MRSRIVMMGILFVTMMLILAGCGGNGGGPTAMEPMEPMEPTTPTPPTCMDEPDDPNCTGPRPMEGPTAMVLGLTAAIADPDGDGKFPADDELEGRPGMDIMSDDGGKLTVDGDELGKNDTNILNAQEFQHMMDASRASLRDFDVNVYQRMKDRKTDTLTVYTNVDEATGEEFDEYYAPGGTVNTDRLLADGATSAFIPGTDTDPETIYGALTFATSGDDEGKGYKHMMGSKIPTGAGQNREIEADDDFTGTFRGIPGTYACSDAGACTLTTNDDNELSVGGTGVLTFTPRKTVNDTEDKHMISGVYPDGNYLVFGYWLQEGTDRAGDATYAVNAFYGGSELIDGTSFASLSSLVGQATYNGEASGMYAKKALSVVDGALVGTPSKAGQFTASASLTANFGADAKVATGEIFMITGTISNFLDDSGTAIDGNWSLALNGDTGNIVSSGDDFGTFSGDTGSGSNKGMWEGQFFGIPRGTDGTALAGTTDYPTSAAGKFTGHFQNGHVIGAFGATKK